MLVATKISLHQASVLRCNPRLADGWKMLLQRFRQTCGGAYNVEEALKRQNLKREDIEAVREKLKSVDVVPKFLVDNQIILFLNSCQGDVDLTVIKMTHFYEQKHSSPEFFSNRDPDSPEIQACLDNLFYVALPITPDNCNLILHRLKSHKPRDYVFDEAVKVSVMKAEEYTYRNGPRSGSIFINDLTGASFMHLFRVSISSLRKGLKFMQEASPLDVKAVHILNVNPLFDAMFNMAKPFLWSEMINKIHLHSSNMDYEKFYKEWIPKSHLPSDYGGDLESTEDLHDKQRKKFMEMRDYFLLEEQQKNYECDQFADEYEEKRKLKK